MHTWTKFVFLVSVMNPSVEATRSHFAPPSALDSFCQDVLVAF